MTGLPRTLRLDGSDTLVFERAAEPGEWAVPGGFAFWDEDPAAMPGKRRQAFRAGFLGLGSLGWATLVEVAEASATEREAALAALAAHLRSDYGAPDLAAARAAAAEEIGFAESLCAGHVPGTVLALTRDLDQAGAVRERFRTLHRRAEGPHRDPRGLPLFAVPVFAMVETDEVEETPDLAGMAARRRDSSA